MARTALTTQAPAQTGTVLTFEAANVDGNMIDGDRSVLLHVINGDASPHTATILSGLAVADEPVVVAAGDHAVIGPFDPRTFDRPSGAADPGLIYVDYDAVTSVTVAAVGRG
jgi:hypothetical protein